MSAENVTNEMLYELIKEFKRDVYKRFEQQDKRMDRIEDNQREDHRLLREIHESRHEVKVQFHWKLAAASVAISAGVSVVVFLAMSALMA
jgi:hypothetical protein